MLENATRLVAEAGYTLTPRLFPAESIPFEAASFDLVCSRIAPHHFSDPAAFVSEAARVLKPGGIFLLIDGSLPDASPEVGPWLNHVEKLRDPSHERFLSRQEWETLVLANGLTILKSELFLHEQPDLNWYFETAGTSEENRRWVREAVDSIPPSVREALRLSEENGTVRWFWSQLRLVARQNGLK